MGQVIYLDDYQLKRFAKQVEREIEEFFARPPEAVIVRDPTEDDRADF